MTGIGAADGDTVEVPSRGGTFVFDAGMAYHIARIEANADRRRAFDALPDFGTPSGTALDYHPENGAHVTERTMGCPIGWKR